MEKSWFYERLFFEMVIVIVKGKKNTIKNTMSIKISFLVYLQWTILMLPAVFEESGAVDIFFATFFFSLLFSIGKRSV